MAGSMSRIGWKIVSGVATAAAGTAANRAVSAIYRRLRGSEPPANSAHPETAWREALLWAAISGVAVGLTKLAAERAAATSWMKATGALPPGMTARKQPQEEEVLI